MSNTNKLVIIIAIILIVICVIIGKNRDVEEKIDVTEDLSYNTVTNEITGSQEYIVYDKNTGEEITRVQEEHQLKIYEMDPTYEELPVGSEEAIQNVDNTIIE